MLCNCYVKMNNKLCINFKKKTRTNKKTKYKENYFECTLVPKETTLSDCNKCSNRRRPQNKLKACLKANKPLNRVSKKNTVRKYTDIPKRVKLKVWERDKGKCIFCPNTVTWNQANSHFIKRSHLGLGIEENIFCACTECHNKFDDSLDREKMLIIAENYLKSKYKNWDKDRLKYKKGGLI